MTVLKRTLPVMFVGWMVAACAGADHALPEVTEEEHAEAVREIRSASNLSPTTRTAEENERIARQVVRNLQAAAGPVCRAADRGRCWYTLQFSPSGVMNAGVLKNHIVLTNGLAQYLETEDEFATVLGHEMGHDIAGHYEKGALNRSIGGILASTIYATVAAAAGQSSRQTHYGMPTAYSIGVQLGDISFSKEHEREADYVGAYLMTRAGYNPQNGKGLWVTLTKAKGKMQTGLFDTHPSGPERLAAWEETVDEVRYSKDLIPNLAGAEKEPRLQQARVFDGGPINSSPEGSAVALAASVSSGSTGASGYEAGFAAGGLAFAGSGAKTAANSSWIAQGDTDSCGAEWVLKLEKKGSVLRGNMWWKGVKYDVYGNIDHKGRTEDARAGKSKDFQTMPAPRFFRLDLAFEQSAARGSFAIDSTSAGCRAEFALRPTSS